MHQNIYTKSSKCFEAWFTLTQDLHAIHTAIDTYMHNTDLDQYVSIY
jgi:hypothetical protein